MSKVVGEGEMGWFIRMSTKQAGCGYRKALASTGWAMSTARSSKIWCYVYSITQLYMYCIFCVYANELRKTKLLLRQLLKLTRNKQSLSWGFQLSFSELSSFPGSCVEEGTQSRVPTSVALALIWNLVNTPKNYWTKISASSYSQSNITTLFRFSNFQYVSTFQPFSTYILYSNTSIFKNPKLWLPIYI